MNAITRIGRHDTAGDSVKANGRLVGPTPLHLDIAPPDAPSLWKALECLVDGFLGGKSGGKVLREGLAMLNRPILGFSQ
jgi:hypothetical protein